MKKLCRFAFTLAILVALSGAQQPVPAPGTPRRPVRFQAIDVMIDPGDVPLAAYQFEFLTRKGDVELIGVEGGDHAAFREAPYYDPAALYNDRVIVAAFHTGGDLPTGRTRVARLHLVVSGEGEPQFDIRLEVAATRDGTRIAAEATVAEGGRG